MLGHDYTEDDTTSNALKDKSIVVRYELHTCRVQRLQAADFHERHGVHGPAELAHTDDMDILTYYYTGDGTDNYAVENFKVHVSFAETSIATKAAVRELSSASTWSIPLRKDLCDIQRLASVLQRCETRHMFCCSCVVWCLVSMFVCWCMFVLE